MTSAEKKRHEKKRKEKENEIKETNNMIAFLEEKWNTKFKYSCSCCLKEAFLAEFNKKDGYITDDELITASNGRLKHK